MNKYSSKFKQNEGFGEPEETGHKRSLIWFLNHLRQEGRDADGLWKEIKRICLKSLCAVQPVLKHYYQSLKSNCYSSGCCFQVLGFDIIVSKNLKPYVLEVNSSPSFGTDSPLDMKIKSGLVRDTFRIVDLSFKRKIEIIRSERGRLAQRMVTGKRQKISHQDRLKTKVKLIKRIERKMEERYGGLGGFERVFGVKEYMQAGVDTSISVIDFVKRKKSTAQNSKNNISGMGRLKRIIRPNANQSRDVSAKRDKANCFQRLSSSNKFNQNNSKVSRPNAQMKAFNRQRKSLHGRGGNKHEITKYSQKKYPQSVKQRRRQDQKCSKPQNLVKAQDLPLFKGFTEDMTTEAKCFGFMAFAEMFEKRSQFKRGRKSDIEDLLLLTNADFNTENNREKTAFEKDVKLDNSVNTSRLNKANSHDLADTNFGKHKPPLTPENQFHANKPGSRVRASQAVRKRSRGLKKFKSCTSLRAVVRVPMRCEKEAFSVIFQVFLKPGSHAPKDLANVCPMIRRLFKLLKFLSQFEGGKDVNEHLHLLADFRWKRICFCRLCGFLTKIERENEFVFVKLKKFLRFYSFPRNKPFSSRQSSKKDGAGETRKKAEITKSFAVNIFKSKGYLGDILGISDL